MHRLLVSVAFVFAIASPLAQVPVADLAKPPADARHFVIQSTGGRHGESWRWTGSDGAHMGRETMNLRGQVFEVDSSSTAGADGMPAAIVIRGVTPQGDAAETFTIGGGTANWKSQIDSGRTTYTAPAFYVSQGGPIDMTAWFLEALLARPDRSLDLLPGGKAHAAKLTDLQVGAGATAQTITLWSITGVGTSPMPMWADASNRFLKNAFRLVWMSPLTADFRTHFSRSRTTAVKRSLSFGELV